MNTELEEVTDILEEPIIEKVEKKETSKKKTLIEQTNPTEEEIKEHLKLQESWCKNEQKWVFNPTKKLHCPYCHSLL